MNLSYMTNVSPLAPSNLALEMFRSRAEQFIDRLEWPLTRAAHGGEVDQYDTRNAVYVIVEAKNGGHLASARLMPTLGPTLLNDHFSHLMDGKMIRQPDTWECTRFCSSKGAPGTALYLLLAGIAALSADGIFKHCVALFDRRVIRIYSRLGITPELLCSPDSNAHGYGVGRWTFEEGTFAGLLGQAPIDLSELTSSAQAFEHCEPVLLRKSA